jgi:hypothetical protein
MWKHLAGALCALALAGPAVAAEVVIQGQGAMTYGLSQDPFIGPRDLAGRPATFTLLYDTALAPTGSDGIFISDSSDWLGFAVDAGGETFPSATFEPLEHIVFVELIENGEEDQFNLIFQAVGQVPAGGGAYTDFADSFAFSFVGDLFTSTAELPRLNGPLQATATGDFSVDDVFCDAGACSSVRRADGGFELTAIRADAIPVPTTAVPEPSAWALMLVGCGLAGGLLRRTRKTGRWADGGVPQRSAV